MKACDTVKELVTEDAFERRFAYKNLIIVTTVFFLIFTSFNSIQNLQTSINKDPDLGFLSLTVLYLSFTIPCFFLPNLLIQKMGCKNTMLMATVGYLIYDVANMYPNWWTLITASIFAGVSACLFWSTQASYISAIAVRYSKCLEVTVKGGVITRFFCIFYFIFQLNQVVGNLISSLVLKQKGGISNTTNSSTLTCGAAFCPSTALPSTSNDVERATVNILLGILIAITCVAIFILYFFLDPLQEKAEVGNHQSTRAVFLSTMKLLGDRRVLMLIPITVISGLEEGFMFGDFTQAYVTCSVGIEMVGFVMICFGATCCATSMVLVTVAKQVSTLVVMVTGLLLHLLLMFSFLFWDIGPTDYIGLFASAGVWGICDAIWQTQIVAFYGTIFHDKRDEAMSLSKLWLSLGFIIAFAYGNLLCQKVKIYIFITLLVLGMSLYGCLEYEVRRLKRVDKRSMESDLKKDGTLQMERDGYVIENKGYIHEEDVTTNVE